MKKDILPKYYRLEQILRKQIMTGQLATSKPVPNERELCENYGVSRTTVRNALAALEADGLIYREQGRGTFVKYSPNLWSFKLKGSVDDLFELGTNVSLTLEKKALIQSKDWLVKDMEMSEPEKIYYFEGIRIWLDNYPVQFQAYVPKEIGQKININEYEGPLFIQAVEQAAGELVKRAIQITSAEIADQQLSDKIGVQIGQPVLVQKRIYYSKRNQVLQVSFNRFPAYVYHNVVEFSRE